MCVRDTRPQRPSLCCFSTQICGTENRDFPGRHRTENPRTLVKNTFSYPGVIITGITITKQMNIQLPNLARGCQWGRAGLIIRTSAHFHLPGWFELTYRNMPVTLRVNHRFDVVYKQSFILSITLWLAVCKQVVQVFLPQSTQVRTGSARHGTQW